MDGLNRIPVVRVPNREVCAKYQFGTQKKGVHASIKLIDNGGTTIGNYFDGVKILIDSNDVESVTLKSFRSKRHCYAVF